MNSKTYKWGNTLNAYVWDDNNDNSKTDESTNIAGFKWGEHYRLGLQFQYKTGKWSQPVFINDETMENKLGSEVDYRPSLNISDEKNYCRQNIPIFKANIDK